MLYLDLCVPVFLESQLKEIAKEADMPLSHIRRLAYHNGPALGITESGELIEIQEEEINENGEHVLRGKKDLPRHYSGTDAVLWLCMQKGIGVEAITKIDIPDSVYYECDKEAWSDICSFFADVSQRNKRVERLTTLGAPSVILLNEGMMLWQTVELLETGKIGNSNRRWTHGRILRSLNDIGFSLDGGWFPSMRESIEVREETEDEKKARHEKIRDRQVQCLISFFVKQGMDPDEAVIRASFRAAGDPALRPCTSEGIGFWFPDQIRSAVIAEFLEKHKASFVRSPEEEKIYERIQAGDDLYEIFEGSKYETDRMGYGFEHWAVAVANVMTRETDIGFNVFLVDPESKYNNRNCIMFEDKSPWLYTEKEKKLSHNMIYQLLDRYALELHLTVSDCYYVMDVFDE